MSVCVCVCVSACECLRACVRVPFFLYASTQAHICTYLCVGSYGPHCPPPWISSTNHMPVVDGKHVPAWELSHDQYADLLNERAASMMENQDRLEEVLFRRSKTLRWSQGHDIISIYQTITVDRAPLCAALPRLKDIVVNKGRRTPITGKQKAASRRAREREEGVEG